MLTLEERKQLTDAIWGGIPQISATIAEPDLLNPDHSYVDAMKVLVWMNEKVTPCDCAIAIGHGNKVWCCVYEAGDDDYYHLEDGSIEGYSDLPDPAAALREAIARCGLMVARTDWEKRKVE